MNGEVQVDMQDLLATIGEKEVRIRLLAKQVNKLQEELAQLQKAQSKSEVVEQK